MPKNRKQETIFTIMMVLFMVYTMICYNITLATGRFGTFIFAAALGELPLMAVIAFVVDTFIVGPLAKMSAFKVVDPAKKAPIFIILAISGFSVLFMCPIMSLIATILFKGGIGANTLSDWMRTTAMNYPMALIWQMLVAGPVVRWIFGKFTQNA